MIIVNIYVYERGVEADGSLRLIIDNMMLAPVSMERMLHTS